MTYDQALEETLTRAQAVAEIKDHDLDPEEFFNEVGNRPTYTGKEILNWLGY